MMLKKLIFVVLLLLSNTIIAASDTLNVCVTVPDLGNLVEEIGGEQVIVTTFAKGTEDPHFIEAKPSFIKSLSQADLFIQLGLEMEIGWSPVLLQNSRNAKLVQGENGFLDASQAITPLEVPTHPIDRSMGDVHAQGNPHYLLDPLNGLAVARLIRDRLALLRPEHKAYFAQRYATFAKKLAERLIGEKLAALYQIEDLPKLATLFERGQLHDFLQKQGQAHLLAGWLGMMQPYYGTEVVDDHDMWIYFAQRFGLKVIAHLEPKPGILPTTTHLGKLVNKMQTEHIKVILSSVYYDPRHAEFVAKETSAKIVKLAHQVGALPGTTDYLSMFNNNLHTWVNVLGH